MSTPLTEQQYSELVCALESVRAASADGYYNPLDAAYTASHVTSFAYVYIRQRLHVLPPLPKDIAISWLCTQMIAELTTERC